MVDLFIIDKQYSELIKRYSGLRLEFIDEKYKISGILKFSAEYQHNRIEDEYSIELTISDDYPDSLPIVREKGNRIPRDFHKYQDNSLCLGASLAIKRKFLKQPTIIGFIERCVIPHLYLYSYKCKYGSLPYGELSHGWLGILEYYQDVFNVVDERIILLLLKVIVDDNYRAHSRCPCGSRKRLRDCHGSLLRKLMPVQPAQEFSRDYQLIIEGLKINHHFQSFKKNNQLHYRH